MSDIIQLTDDEKKQLNILLITTNSISLILSLITVIIHCILKKDMRAMSLYFSIFAIGLHVFLLIGPIVNPLNFGVMCFTQAAGIQFFAMGNICWFFCISLQLYLAVVWKKSSTYLQKTKLIQVHSFAWGFPLLTTVIPVGANVMESNGIWCWMKQSEQVVWQWVCFYVPLMFFLVLVLFFWVNSVIRVRQYISRIKTTAYIFQNMVGVLVLFMSYTLQCVHRILDAYLKRTFIVEAIHVGLLSSLGIIVFLMYGFTYHNYSSLYSLFYSCWRQRAYDMVQEDEGINDDLPDSVILGDKK